MEIVDYSKTFPKRFSNHSLETYMTCPRKFEHQVLQGLRTKGQHRALLYGHAGHEGLAAWYRYGAGQIAHEDALKQIEKLTGELAERNQPQRPFDASDDYQTRVELMIRTALVDLPEADENSIDHRTPELLETTLRSYAIFYRVEPFKVLYVESTFIVPLPDGNLYGGIIDLGVEWNDQLLIIDHKFPHSLYGYDSNFDPSQQITGYINGMVVLVANAALTACINGIQVPHRKEGFKPVQDFKRFPNIYRTAEQLEEFRNNAVVTIADIKRDLERGFFRQNFSQCHMYGGCPFRNICKTTPGSDREVVVNSLYDQEFIDPMQREKA